MFRVVSWNVDSRPTGSFDAKLDLLHRLAPDLALLRELRRPVYRGLLPHAQAYERLHGRPRLFAWGVLSTDLTDPPADDRRAGCAVLGGRGTTPLEVMPLGPRAVAVRVSLAAGAEVTACSGRSPRVRPGVDVPPPDGGSLGAFLRSAPAGTVAGVDGPGETGSPLRSVAGAGVGTARRDRLLVGRHLCVRSVDLVEQEALATGSDSALVVADLEWDATGRL